MQQTFEYKNIIAIAKNLERKEKEKEIKTKY